MDNQVAVGLRFEISKVDNDEQLVFGYANVSIAKGGALISDLQEDSISPQELEKTAYEFVLTSGEADAMHRGPAVGKCVESMVFTPAKLEKLATDPTTGKVDQEILKSLQKALPPRWWVGFKLDKSAFAKVKDGTYTMFSIAGQADRVDLEKGGAGSGAPLDTHKFQLQVHDGDTKTKSTAHQTLGDAHQAAQAKANETGKRVAVHERESENCIAVHAPMGGA